MGGAIILALILLLAARPGFGGEDLLRIPLRVDAPPGALSTAALFVSGGIPFPRGRVTDSSRIRLLLGSAEIPAQVTTTAVWPGGSVKWARVETALAPGARGLVLECGPGVERMSVPDPIRAEARGRGVVVEGDGLSARIGPDGGLSGLTVGGRQVLSKSAVARLALRALRTSGPDAFRGPSRILDDPSAKTVEAAVEVREMTVEDAGPLRVRVLARGVFLVPGLGAGLPKGVLEREPPGELPFSLRLEFFRDVPAVIAHHQLVFSGEPDRDFITRWGYEIPGQGAGRERVVLEPGLTVDRSEESREVVTGPGARLCFAPLAGGFALLRSGWENRPAAVGGPKGGTARVDFWPPEAGPFDLRRQAREWGIGETGDRDRPEDMERYSRYAARGLAKSHSFVLWFGEAGDPAELAAGFDGPALLVAPPAWYAASGALGPIAPEVTTGPFAGLESGLRRYLDWFLCNQDLYRWHGKLEYGFWQTRNGDIHRHDRWDRDYGRWGWSLGDGAGRIGHVLLLEYLRTLERRYFTAGEAWNRAVYDTSMVHTETHLENARDNWWRVRGTNHRHGVQPFGGPYVGMRGSYPGGHRILWHLSGNGVIGDGLDLVAAAALDFATTRPGAFGASGGPDGQGSGALALLHKHETTGEKRYLEAARTILDRSGLFPPADPGRLSYGADFGLFLAGMEYADLTGDREFVARVLAVADAALGAKDTEPYVAVLGWALSRSGEEKYRTALEKALGALDFSGSLAELPVSQWPGHGGARRAPSRANIGRDLAWALAPFAKSVAPGEWPDAVPDPATRPAVAPPDWWRPGGGPERGERPPDAARILKKRPARGPRSFEAGDAVFATKDGVLVSVVLAGREFLSGPATPVLRLVDEEGRLRRAAGGSGDGAEVSVVWSKEAAGGCPSLRIEAAARTRKGGERIGAFGIRLPLALGEDARAIQVSAPGAFRLERWRIDMTDERIPGWLNSDERTRWPRWRGGGILAGEGGSYRIWRQNRPDTAPTFVDQGFGAPAWLDVTDRGGERWIGLTARVIRGEDATLRGIEFSEQEGLTVWFSSPAGGPIDGEIAGAADLILHDGWRPPLSPPDLTRAQFRAMLDDLDYGSTIGLFALRFLLSETHQTRDPRYKDLLAATGVEPRELLLSMEWKGGLEAHCKRIGVRYDPDHPDETVRRVIDHYR